MARFLHLHTFYPDAITHLYERTPDLKLRSYNQQMEAIIEDAFSAIHIFTPYLSQMGYETQFIVANNPFSQEKWLKENNVPLRNPNNWIKDITKAQIEAFKPDVLYTCDSTTFDSAFFRSLDYRPKVIMGWRGADISESLDWTEYDVILSGLPALLEQAKIQGASHGEFFFPGFPIHITQQVAHIQPRFDVVFTGSWTTHQHHQRNSYLRYIAQQSHTPEHNYSVMYYLAGRPQDMPSDLKEHLGVPRFGLSMHKLLRKGRINFDARSAIRLVGNNHAVDLGKDHTINMRIFETLGTGCFLLTEYFEGLKRYFEPGKELETFSDKGELLEKIRYYLDHPSEREAIAQKGQLRCHSDYSMEQRVIEFDHIIKKHLKLKSTQTSLPKQLPQTDEKQSQKSPQMVEQLLNQSLLAYKQGQFNEAYEAATEAKNWGLPLLNIDYLRAASLLKLGQPQNALQALTEELTLFPQNTNAKQLHAQIQEAIKNAREHTKLTPDS